MTTQSVEQLLETASVADHVSASDFLLAGFPAADLVGLALDQVPGQVVPGVRVGVEGVGAPRLSEAARIMRGPRSGVGQAEGPQGRVRCSPGTVELAAIDEGRAERVRSAYRAGRGLSVGVEVDLGDDVEDLVYVDPATGEVLGRFDELKRTPARSRITEWSGKSRANMIRRMAATDWRPMLTAGAAPMVTLTYPPIWRPFAPTRATVGRHLEAFKEAYRRDFLTAPLIGPLPMVTGRTGKRRVQRRPLVSLGPVMGAWKIEYQRRGAPHLHLLLPIPVGFSVSMFRDWVGATWHGIIWRDRGADFLRCLLLVDPALGQSDYAALLYAEHARRSRVAGTAVDVREGARMTDPRRIALYFLGHSTKHRDGKEYQHRVPDSFAGLAGRWWGVWGLPDATEDRYVDSATWWRLREVLGDYALANGRSAFQGGAMHGGWLAVNDGPSFLARLVECFELPDDVGGCLVDLRSGESPPVDAD